MDITFLWVPVTLIAAAGQVARNAMQRRLTETIGTVGATQVRFLYGFPFALVFLACILLATGESLPGPGAGFAGFLVLGAVSQILATAMMLAAMRDRSFSVVTALIKTEAIQIAVFGFLVLGDRLSLPGILAVGIASAGVVAMSWSKRTAGEALQGGLKPIALGIVSGGLFALSAVGYRGAILALDSGSFLVRASTTLSCALALQTAILLVWLLAFDRAAMMGSLREWRSSLLAGFTGAAASQFWFIGFALTAAANVRTLALVEVLMAQAVSRKLLHQDTSRREIAGMAMIVVGVLLLLVSAR
ncbi:EamA family transporter [Enterovirga rhinocerotis]|uniref:EamA-like transporter family protein n=1 Tax=Enterovirga rhinocerotis TaxID=1339210 RepID=A0A4R7BUT9_9HYPH|nr:EamA family transporter [Enterovirga rhinocerotis]TDR89560.1 EamA-like transporter family protein [Enterovirga rhinocerotis]